MERWVGVRGGGGVWEESGVSKSKAYQYKNCRSTAPESARFITVSLLL